MPRSSQRSFPHNACLQSRRDGLSFLLLSRLSGFWLPFLSLSVTVALASTTITISKLTSFSTQAELSTTSPGDHCRHLLPHWSLILLCFCPKKSIRKLFVFSLSSSSLFYFPPLPCPSSSSCLFSVPIASCFSFYAFFFQLAVLSQPNVLGLVPISCLRLFRLSLLPPSAYFVLRITILPLFFSFLIQSFCLTLFTDPLSNRHHVAYSFHSSTPSS